MIRDKDRSVLSRRGPKRFASYGQTIPTVDDIFEFTRYAWGAVDGMRHASLRTLLNGMRAEEPGPSMVEPRPPRRLTPEQTLKRLKTLRWIRRLEQAARVPDAFRQRHRPPAYDTYVMPSVRVVSPFWERRSEREQLTAAERMDAFERALAEDVRERARALEGREAMTVMFELQAGGVHRTAVLAAAEELRLRVRHTTATAFEVDVAHGSEAYRLGQRAQQLIESIKRRNP